MRVVDVFSPFNQLLLNAASFGFTDITTPCVDGLLDTTACADPDAHLFWDTIHPTTRVHAMLAGVFSDAFNATVVPLPPSWLLLGPVVGWLATRASRTSVRRI